jgi:hypothetical protein
MGAGLTRKQISNKLRYLRKKNPGQDYVVLTASNGEVAIVTKEWYRFSQCQSIERRKV